MNNIIKYCFAFIVLFVPEGPQLLAQGFEVKIFEQNINDGSAFHAPLDDEGHPCGLIKVRTDDASLKFKGNVVGEVENKTNEYWVYIPQGSRSLLIMHPNFLPLSVDFSAYGVVIVPKATYVLTLSGQKFKKEKCGLIATVKPETACLYINDELVENLSGNGFYQLYLPKGDYICRLEQKGYRPNVQAVTIGKGTQALNIDLESVMAELTVKCKTSTAELYVDGELKGNGIWSGCVIPGKHRVEAKQNNYESVNQTINLSENEIKTLSIQELRRSISQIRIETKPNNVAVILDGKDIGQSPCVVDVETGEHYVTYSGYGLKPLRKTIKVEGSLLQTVTLELKYENDEYSKAYNGNLDVILEIANDRNWRGKYDETMFWINKHPNKDYLILNWNKYWKQLGDDAIYGWWRCDWLRAYSETGNPEKAMEIYSMVKEDMFAYGGFFSPEIEMECIGKGFLKKKKYDEAISCFLKAVESDPDNDGFGLEGLGDCYKEKGDKQKAAYYYQRYLNSNARDERSRFVEIKMKELEY